MKKIFALILSAIFFCLILTLAGCGKNKPMGSDTTASDTLSETTQTTQSTTVSESSTSYETTEASETSEFFDSSNGTLESTANPETAIPEPLRKN